MVLAREEDVDGIDDCKENWANCDSCCVVDIQVVELEVVVEQAAHRAVLFVDLVIAPVHDDGHSGCDLLDELHCQLVVLFV